MTSFTLNGKAVEVSAPSDTPLLWVLRDDLGFTGTKYGCGIAVCGACTVHVDGRPVRSCSTPISAVAGKSVSTIESVHLTAVGQAVQAAWARNEVPQCGYCQSGQIMSAVALLAKTPKPTDAQIDEAMRRNLCRCGTYHEIRAAIKDAAATLHG
ncbi:MAG TPA: (2Fe-2S)-binding protein [Steroidobacteraceae bacterium]|nr:(2Fe-2S)-binding protein [Steroidobacteraceae bacterium]